MAPIRSSRSGRGLARILVGLFLLGSPCEAVAANVLTVTAEHLLPAELRRARDVRWAGSARVLLGVTETGVVEAATSNLSAFEVLVPDARNPRTGMRLPGIWAPSRLGVSDRFVAIGAPVFEIGWFDRQARRFVGKVAVEGIEDIDLQGDRVLVVGTRRGDDGELAPDGAIAWIGSLVRGLEDMRPVLFSESGPGAVAMDNCGNFEISAVRFLADGGFVVAPGAEPGIHLFDAEGRLRHVWSSEELGLEPPCRFDTAKRDLLGRDPEARWAWINQFRTIDDILPLPGGPALVLRDHVGGVTRWQLVVLRPNERPRAWILPWTSPSGLSHLRGDVREGRIVFLQMEEGRPEKPPAEPPRLYVVEAPP